LEKLQEQERLSGKPVGPYPASLPRSDIKQLPDIFQPRHKKLDVRHVEELAKLIKRGVSVDPVVVYPMADGFVLIDGHHRVAAYKQAGGTKAIPVKVFDGTLEEAVLASGLVNGRTRLPMTKTERMDYAWRLIKFERYSKAQVCEASSVSDGQVGKMRRVFRHLGEYAEAYDTWEEARKADQVVCNEPLSDDELDAKLERKAQKMADQLAQTFGSRLAKNPEVTARALEIHLGRRAPDVANELAHLTDQDDPYDEDDDDF
jgi:hypothetical protein